MGAWAVIASAGMVGRQAELSRVLGCLDKAAAGAPGLVVVAGDAGVGKTRFVREVCDRAEADGWAMLNGACVELSEGAAILAPVAQVLRQLGRERGDDGLSELLAGPARWLAPLVPELTVGIDVPDDGSAVQVLVSFHRLLRDLADEQPVLLVLEDLHWADASTRDLLRHLASRLADERLVVVTTVRTDDLDRRHPLRPVLAEVVRRPDVDRIDLGPLEDDALLAHLASLVGDEQDLDLTTIVDRAEGNPFHAEELLAAGGDASMPPSLEEVLSLRLERLPSETQQLLGEMAVLGATVDPAMVGYVSKLETGAVRTALRAALDDGVLVVDDGGYAFRHALLREVALARLLPDERTAAHAAAARALEAEPDRAVVGRAGAHGQAAHHWWEARDLPRCLAASVAAAGESRRAFADSLTLHHARRTIELWDRIDGAEELTGTTYPAQLLVAARAANDLHDPQARELATAAIRAADDAGEELVRAEATEMATRYLQWHGRSREALELAAAERARHGDARTTAASLALTAHAGSVAWVGWTRAEAWDLDATADDLDRAVAIAREQDDWTAEFVAHVQIVDCLGPFVPGRRETSLERMLDLAESRDYENWAHTMAAWSAGIVGDANAQHAALARTPTWDGSFTSVRSPHAQWSMSISNDTWFGRLDAALQRIGGVELRDLEGQYFVVGWMVISSGDVLRWTGHADRALDRAEFAATTSRDLSLASVHVIAELAASRAATGGTPHEVVATAASLSESFGFMAWHLSVPKLVAAVARAARDQPLDNDLLGEVDGWLDRFESFMAWLPHDAPVRPWATVCLQQAQAERAFLAGDPDPRLWDAVVAELDARGGTPAVAIARLRRAAAAAAVHGGSSPGVEDDLHAAWSTFTDLGMTMWEDDAVELARRLRVDLPGSNKDGEADVLPSLTDREREVLALVAKGWTNKRVGEHLFISPKTVSVHLSNAMRKLDVDSRTQAVLAAQRAGLTAAD